MSSRKVSPRKATVLTSVVLASTMIGGPALAATHIVTGSQSVRAAAVGTVVSRVSMLAGPSAGGTKLLISGTDLATAATVEDVTTYTARPVKFGAVTVNANDVTALSTTALEVVVPAKTTAAKVTVLVGPATKGPTYTYISDDLTVSTVQDDLSALTPSSDFGQTGATLEGANFEATTKVLVGGLPAKATVTSDEITYALPAGRTGVQDVVVSDPRNSVYVGHVTYTALTPTLSATSSYAVNEGPTKVTLTGTNLNAVTAVSFEKTGTTTEKLTFAKTTDPTKLEVTVPKGAAKDGTVKVATKYGKSATVALERKASVKPTVTAVAGAVSAGGIVTLTGTDLVGLKAVKATSAAGKVYAGVVSSVDSDTSAKVKFPVMPAGDYNLVATTLAAAASDAQSFTVATSAPTGSGASVDDTKKVITVAGNRLKAITKAVITPATGTAITRTGTTNLVPNADGTSLTVKLATALADGTYGVVVTNALGSTLSIPLVVSTPATLSDVSYAPSVVDPASPAQLTLTGTGLEVGAKVRYYVTADGNASATVVDVTAKGAATSTADLAGDLLAGDYSVEVSSDGTTWSTAVALTVV